MSPPATGAVYLLKAGEMIGVYRVVRPLGAGGMGQVFLVEHEHLRKRYALKILPTEISQDSQFIDRFRIEARVMADLEHPGIVRVHNFGEDNGRHYLVMDYVEGPDGAPRTLDDELAWGRKLPDAVVAQMALQLCDALDYAHTFPAGAIIHRDLKPGNILLHSPAAKTGPNAGTTPPAAGPDMRVKVADFGLAKIVGTDYIRAVIDRSTTLTTMPVRQLSPDGQATEVTTAGGSTISLLGTYDYMSPEQKTGLPVDARSDIYALGLILYRMLTGHKPEGSYDPPSKAGVRRGWDAIIAKCLKRELEERYASAAALKKDILALETAGARRIQLGLAAAGAVVVMAALAVAIFRSGPASPPRAQTPVAETQGTESAPEPPRAGPVELTAAAAPMTIPFTVTARPAGATLRVTRNNELVAETSVGPKGARVDLRQGLYSFEVRLAGHQTARRDIAVAAGNPREWSVDLQVITGLLNLLDAGAATVSILSTNGQPVAHGAPDTTTAGKQTYVLPVGEYEVVVAQPDYEAFARRVTIVEGVPTDVRAQLVPLPGSLKVTVEPVAEIWDGNRRLGTSGEWIRGVPAGPHTLELRAARHRTAQVTLAVPPNGEAQLTAAPLELKEAKLTVRAEVRNREVEPQHLPKRGWLKIGDGEAREVDLPWSGVLHDVDQPLQVDLDVAGYDTTAPETIRLRDRDDRTVAFRLLPLPVKVTIRSNVPGDVFRLRAGQTAQGWKKFVFGRDIPIGKTGEPITIDAFAETRLTVMAEGYAPATVAFYPTRPGSEDETATVTLAPP